MQVHEDNTRFSAPHKDDTRKREQWKDKKYSAKAMSTLTVPVTTVANGTEESQSADLPKEKMNE